MDSLIMFKTYKGKFIPKNPNKYLGDPNNIIYRSSWELKVFVRMDTDPNIIKWASEEFSIPYINPIDNRPHKYYPDVYAENSKGQKFVIEIKPEKQTQPPKKPSRNSKRYITEVSTYMINKAKWNAAEVFCTKQGWTFKIATERDLGIIF